MPADLRTIRTFEQLVRYLGDELDWPVEDYELDQLAFDYDPADLGLKDEQAAAIKPPIRQLRPLPGGQPWGIFFVEFEKKRLPIVVLRRILSHLVVNKRESANKGGNKRWNANDLLFISAFGQDTDREIAFAHFHQESGDLPTLRVLGWDGGNTTLTIAGVEHTLREKLHWPEKGESADQWRERWSGAFRHRIGHRIHTADNLADVLAQLARGIRDRAKTMLAAESDRGSLTKLYKAFQTALIHDLTAATFADTYAQTITYGLLTAAISRTEMSAGAHGTALIAENVADIVPVTNPFLKEMLQTFLKVGGRKAGIDFDELGIQDVVELLRGDETDLPAVIKDFGHKNPEKDPVIHFYEHFLSAYDHEQKVKRGVFYTPPAVVSYIVRSVHELLQTEFGLEDGLASTATWAEMQRRIPGLALPKIRVRKAGDSLGQDKEIPADTPFVQILDPATGTATFLVEVIDLIHRTVTAKWKKEAYNNAQRQAAWNEYVPKHLLPRLHGYELMMAPYAIAHMKIGLKLYETGYRFGTEERARIYLTNALDPAHEVSDQLESLAPALAHEARAVNDIKRYQRFTIVVGNPPYANYSANLSPQARRIVDKYRNYRGVPIRERNQLQFERNIQDDFVKFISIGGDAITATGSGILGYITNATMLASASLRGMREHLLKTYCRLYELNLHGGVNEIIAGADNDQNVFDIAQSVGIHIYVRHQGKAAQQVEYAHIAGKRSVKYAELMSRTIAGRSWESIKPDSENSRFIPQDADAQDTSRRLDSCFVKFGAGIKTNRDAVAIAFDDKELLTLVGDFDAPLPEAKNAKQHIHPLLYRPFDVRRIFYHEDIIASRSLPTMKHILSGANIGLISTSTWTTPDLFSVNVSRVMVEMKTGTHDRGTTFFPLYRWEHVLTGKLEQVHNLKPDFIRAWSSVTGLRFVPVGKGDLAITTGPEDVLAFFYALFHSGEYRRRFKAALAQGFPVVLMPSNVRVLKRLAEIGNELVAIHLLESPKHANPTICFYGGDRQLVRIGEKGKTLGAVKNGVGRVSINRTSGFADVPQEVWDFHIGGYQVCHKWLDDRRKADRSLSDDDIAHYYKIVVALNETIRIMPEVDAAIEQHGGWPGAFAAASSPSSPPGTPSFL